MERLRTFLSREWTRRIAAFCLIFFAFFSAFPSRFFWSVFALPVLAGLIIPFFLSEWWFNGAAATLCAAILSFSEYDTPKRALLSMVLLVLLFLLSMAAGMALRGFFAKPKQRLLGSFGILGALLLFATYFFCFGNPISLFQSQNHAIDYLASTYPAESFSLTGTYYDSLSKSYVTGVTYNRNGVSYGARVDKALRYGDTYFEDLLDTAREQQKSALLTILHACFSDGLYDIKVQGTPQKPESVTARVGDNPEEYRLLWDYTLRFTGAVQTESSTAKAEFASRVRDYVAALSEANFPYHSILFCGGEQDTVVFEVRVIYGQPVQEITPESVIRVSS